MITGWQNRVGVLLLRWLQADYGGGDGVVELGGSVNNAEAEYARIQGLKDNK